MWAFQHDKGMFQLEALALLVFPRAVQSITALMSSQQDITWTVSGRTASWHPPPRAERPLHAGMAQAMDFVFARLRLELARLRAELARLPQGSVILLGHPAQKQHEECHMSYASRGRPPPDSGSISKPSCKTSVSAAPIFKACLPPWPRLLSLYRQLRRHFFTRPVLVPGRSFHSVTIQFT